MVEYVDLLKRSYIDSFWYYDKLQLFDDWEHSLLVFKKVYGLCFNMRIACYLIMKSFMSWATVMTYNDARKSVWHYIGQTYALASIHTS